MQSNYESRMKIAQKHWDSYVAQKQEMLICPDDMNPQIWESWKRSSEYGVDPMGMIDVFADNRKYQKALERDRYLLDVSIPYIESMYRNIIGSNHLFQIVSREGYILKTVTKEKKILDILYDNRRSLLEGADVSERKIGTNSSGLCLELGEPVEIFATEHFNKHNHRFCCVSAPIYGKEELLGCLTLMCPREDYQAFSFGLLNATVESIRKEQQLRGAWLETTKTNEMMRMVLQMHSEGMILMDKDYRIRFHNEKAAEYLNLNKDESFGETFLDLVEEKSLPAALKTPNGGFPMMPVYLNNRNGDRCELLAQLITVHTENSNHDYIISFKPLKQTYSVVNAVGGSRATYTFDSIIGGSDQIKQCVSQSRHAAHSDSTVLIQGESGTGKELIAQSIHNASARANGPFVAINCGSIPKELIASELFGYEAGAFTGADKHGALGKFELADGGTLFLDEIGDMPFDLQVSLLRVLQDQKVSRLGSKTPRNVNVRVIAATNRDLRKEIANRTFREDLFYRLNVLNITLPPLRERRQDIVILASHFAKRYSNALGKNSDHISDEAMQALLNYSWPGNIRELENVIERAVNFSMTDWITLQDLPEEIVRPAGSAEEPVRPQVSGSETENGVPAEYRNNTEYMRLLELLQKHHGNVQDIAEETGVPASTLYGKLSRYHIRAKNFRTI